VTSDPDLHAQLAEVKRLFPRSVPTEVAGLLPDLWIPHGRFWILPRFAPDHPFSPPHVYLSPPILSRHYYRHPGEWVERLCWCKPHEWTPRMRLLIAVTAAMRFLNDWNAHLVD